MINKISTRLLFSVAVTTSLVGCDNSDGNNKASFRTHNNDADSDSDNDADSDSDGVAHRNKAPKFNVGAYNLHLERPVTFTNLQPDSDADRGRRLFGVSEDLLEESPGEAIFEGVSAAAQGEIVSNGRTCFTCHRGADENFGLPAGILSDSIDLSDALFTEIDADAGGDPDAFDNLNQRGLIKYRVNRFDPRVAVDHPYRQVFGWRKSPRLQNTALQHGFLTDLRGRVMFEAARGAVFSHTQSGDDRFDDLFPLTDGNDMEAFLANQLTDPALAALGNPADPNYAHLASHPFATVPVTTNAQRRGRRVFRRKCLACHNTPQVFGNLDHVNPLGNGDRPPTFPGWAPAVSRAFNVGISERNAHNLRFTKFNGPGDYAPIVVLLADEDGGLNQHTVETDIGLAMTTARTEDIGRFKVPQLRNLAENGPYFHDNSANTIEQVVDYFCSDDYNHSQDGQDYPIVITDQMKSDLIEFLYIL